MIQYSKEQDGTMNVMVSGYLPKDAFTNDKVILFSVCYGKQKYMDVKVWRNSDDLATLAACLEKHDTVFVCGTHDAYTNKNGERKTQLTADFLMPMTMPAAAPSEPDAQNQAAAGTWKELDDNDGELPF